MPGFVADDQKERERDLVTAEMIPTAPTKLSFWQKFFELHYKMMFVSTDSVQNHMYSSEPFEWPLMSRGIAYWVSSSSNVSNTFATVIFLLQFYLFTGSNPLVR